MIIRRSLEIGLESVGQGRVPQLSIPGPSCAHSMGIVPSGAIDLPHSIPDSGPIRIQNADLTRTTLNSGVYINWPSQASSRITPIDVIETPSPDLDSPHLLFSDLIETPTLDRRWDLSGNRSLTDPQREERIAGGLRPVLVLPHLRAACPDTRLDLDAAPPEAAAISRAERPPTVLDIPETGWLESTRRPEPSHRHGSRSPRRHSRKRPRNRSSALYRPKKRPPHPGNWCE